LIAQIGGIAEVAHENGNGEWRLPPEFYVVEIDGNITSVFGIFPEALRQV
jgi:hypothetical protein